MGKADIRPAFCVGLAFALIMIPFRLVVAWSLATLVHECFHFLAIKIIRKQIFHVKIGFAGAIIETEAMTYGQEIFCALAGPVGGLLLLFVAKYFPLLAVCGFLQSIFNLLPLFPLDGGRVMRCAIYKIFDTKKGQTIFELVEKTVATLLCLYAAVLILKYRIIFVPLCGTVLLLMKTKLSCKPKQ